MDLWDKSWDCGFYFKRKKNNIDGRDIRGFQAHLLFCVLELYFDLLRDLVLLGESHAGHVFDITEIQGLQKKERK